MILSFKKTFPDKSPTGFVQKILSGQKIHTMREGERWKAGYYIHMATGTRTKNYDQFNIERPDLQKCIATQKVVMVHKKNKTIGSLSVEIDGRFLSGKEVADLINNDGLTFGDFWQWFFPKGLKVEKWQGQLIHWTHFKY